MFRNEAKTIIKYVMSGGIAYVVDILLFAFFERLLYGLLGNTAIIVATVFARIISTLCNYLINSRVVFGARNRNSLVKYLALVCCQMFVSAGSVYCLNSVFVNVNDVFIKVPVDAVLMMVNYLVQKKYIFKGKKF